MNLSETQGLNLSNLRGCGTILLIVFLAGWIIGISGMDLFIRWTMEQSLFESSVAVQDIRWLIHMGFTVLLLLTLIPIALAVKNQRLKLAFWLWTSAAAFALLTTPAKSLYLTRQTQSIFLIGAAILVMVIVSRIRKEKPTTHGYTPERSNIFGYAALVGLGLAIPWILWGALGSLLDVVLGLVFSVLFSVFVAEFAVGKYLSRTQPIGHKVSTGEFLFDGFVVAVFLLITVTGLGQNGSQLLLFLSIPFGGWLITAFSTLENPSKGQIKSATSIIACLLLALPTLFFDMDELSLAITGTAGEIFEWANRAALYTFFLHILLILAMALLFKQMKKLRLSWKASILFTCVCLLGFGMIYFGIGTPGFFGDQLFVIFKSHVDPTSYSSISPLEDRKKEIYASLTDDAISSQSEIHNLLTKFGIDHTQYYLENAMEVSGGLLMKLMLQNNPAVDRILDSPRLRPLPKDIPSVHGEILSPPEGSKWNLEMIGVPEVHEKLKISGKGIVIGQTDSGVDGTHPELKTSYRGFGQGDDFNWLDPWNESTSPVDIGGHGTMTLGIEVGKDIGIAPDAEWIGCVNLARNLGNPAIYLECMQFMFAPYPQNGDAFTDGDPTKGAMIINNSWGCPQVEGCDQDVYQDVMQVLKDAGIFMSAAAGNSGYYGCSTVTDPPAIYDEVFTVGSINKAGQLSSFSSLGPATSRGSKLLKPDLIAPGEQLLLAASGGGYTFGDGTSFAAPHVTGAVALMWSANPGLIGDIDATTKILLETARDFTGSEPECGKQKYGSGAGVLDAYSAVLAAIRLK